MKTLLSLLSMMITIFGYTQDVGLDWAKQFTGIEDSESYSIKIDAAGNVYTTGFFQGTFDFDPGDGTFNLTSQGYHDAYVSKLDNDGNFIWAKQFKGDGSVRGFSISIDDSLNIYTSGLFQGGPVDFDPGPDVFLQYGPTGYPITYISKLDANGDFVWVKSIEGTDYVTGLSISTDDSSNVYLGGSFKGIADLNPVDSAVVYVTSAGFYDFFVLKLSSMGVYKWGAQFGGSGNDHCTSISIDEDANVHATGSFDGEIDFDPSENGYLLSGDAYVLKLNLNGDFVAAGAISGTSAAGLSIAVDNSGNMYYGGIFSGTVDFDPGTGVFEMFSSGGTNIFVSKLDINGNFLWAGQMGGPGYDFLNELTLDETGNVYSTGYFKNTADFDPGSGTYELSAVDVADVFVSSLDVDGGFVWAKRLGGANHEEGFSIVVDNSGNVYSCGSFTQSADFDPGPEFFTMTVAGNGDSYVHKMKPLVTGLDGTDNFNDVEISLFPNPNSGSFTVNGEDLQKMELYGTDGKLIETIDLGGNSQFQVSLDSKFRGLYLMKISTGEGESVIRVSIQ